MKINQRINLRGAFALLVAISFSLCFPPTLRADVLILQSGAVITGNVLQQDANGVLMQMAYGTYRYPLAMIKDVKREPAAAPHVAINGQPIPDWAQIVTLLANNPWATGLRQVPAAMIESGDYKNVPYVSFRSASGLYELNIFGDLKQPAAVQIGAMNYLHQTSQEKSNCVNFICSVLANAADRKLVRALGFDQQATTNNGALKFAIILPGAWGSYGGWWISVSDTNALASARASEAELLVLAQSRVAAAPPVAATAPGNAPITANPPAAATTAQPTTTIDSGAIYSSGTYSLANGWTSEELAAARPVTPTTYPTDTGNNVYPRTYTREGGTYGLHRR